MMHKEDLIKEISNIGAVAVIRSVPMDKIEELADSLIRGGIRALEVTVDSPYGYDCIRILSWKYGDQIIIGAGTVLDSSAAVTAINSGANFIVSPCLNIEVIRATLRYGKVSVPGIMTPSEALFAIENGADLVKVFPAESVGPRFASNLRGPLPHIPVMFTGGINLDNVSDYIRAGAHAVGIGGNLVNNELISTGNFSEIENIARQYVKAIKLAREE